MQALQNISNEEFENAVLGSILIDPKVMDKVSTLLGTDDCYKSANRELYSLLLKMQREHVPIDMMTIFERAQSHKIDRVIGGSQRLIYLTETTPASANYKYYAAKVKEASDKRSFVTTLTSLVAEVSEDKIGVTKQGPYFTRWSPLAKLPRA